MSSFTNASGFRPIPLQGKWQVTEDFRWYFEEVDGDSVIIPKGFIFDGASIPFPITVVLPKVHPDYMQSAALHDYLLDNLRAILTRNFIDIQFYNSLRVLGNSKIRSWCMYQAVKNFGLLTEGKKYYQKIK